MDSDHKSHVGHLMKYLQRILNWFSGASSSLVLSAYLVFSCEALSTMKKSLCGAGQPWCLPVCSQLETPFYPRASLLQIDTEELQQHFPVLPSVYPSLISRGFSLCSTWSATETGFGVAKNM